MTRDSNRSKWNAIYQNSEITPEIDIWLFNIIKQYSKPPSKVLELACGRGVLARAMAAEGYDVVATDFSKKALLQIPKTENLTTLHIDLTQNFPKGEFDLIIARYFFDALLIGKIENALKPNGFLVIKTFDERILTNKPLFNKDWILASRHFDERCWQMQWHQFDEPANTSALIAQKL